MNRVNTNRWIRNVIIPYLLTFSAAPGRAFPLEQIYQLGVDPVPEYCTWERLVHCSYAAPVLINLLFGLTQICNIFLLLF